MFASNSIIKVTSAALPRTVAPVPRTVAPAVLDGEEFASEVRLWLDSIEKTAPNADDTALSLLTKEREKREAHNRVGKFLLRINKTVCKLTIPQIDAIRRIVVEPKPVVETEEPVVETEEPVVETEAPVVEPKPVVETEEPVVEPKPVVESEEPVKKTKKERKLLSEFKPSEDRTYKFEIHADFKVKEGKRQELSEDDKVNARRAYQRQRYQMIYAAKNKKKAEEKKALAAEIMAPI
jgi:hypothetical protein